MWGRTTNHPPHGPHLTRIWTGARCKSTDHVPTNHITGSCPTLMIQNIGEIVPYVSGSRTPSSLRRRILHPSREADANGGIAGAKTKDDDDDPGGG
ncbi:hypothetical protein NL676_019070 [Syzygium grande]|nr:hypothetical protein NL676_019070 [Syzygium grande]